MLKIRTNIEGLAEKLSEKNIYELKEKIINHVNKNQLIFNNKIQLAELKILNIIDDLLTNEEYIAKYYIECNACQTKHLKAELTLIDNDYICQSCLDNFYHICDNCGEYIYQDNVNYFNDICYCEECFFEAKQEAYNKHKIINPLILELINNKVYNNFSIYDLEFKIKGYIFTIEKYSKAHRLGSFSANHWVDIGNNSNNLLQAVDYYLQENDYILESLYLKDIKIVEEE